jgi:hypothetical protein
MESDHRYPARRFVDCTEPSKSSVIRGRKSDAIRVRLHQAAVEVCWRISYLPPLASVWPEIVLSFAFSLGKIAEYVPEDGPVFVLFRIEA